MAKTVIGVHGVVHRVSAEKAKEIVAAGGRYCGKYEGRRIADASETVRASK